MLKKIAIALMLILPMGVAAQTLKFGHVTSNEIIMAMPEFTKAQTDLQALEKKYTDEIKKNQRRVQQKVPRVSTSYGERFFATKYR